MPTKLAYDHFQASSIMKRYSTQLIIFNFYEYLLACMFKEFGMTTFYITMLLLIL
jgi:hypothetical protein